MLLGALFLTSGAGASSSGGYGQQYGGYQQKSGNDYQNFNRNKRESDYGKIITWSYRFHQQMKMKRCNETTNSPSKLPMTWSTEPAIILWY